MEFFFWTNGGTTTLDNLVLLCGEHHRALHKGAFTIQRLGHQEFRFTAADGTHLDPAPTLPKSTIPTPRGDSDPYATLDPRTTHNQNTENQNESNDQTNSADQTNSVDPNDSADQNDSVDPIHFIDADTIVPDWDGTDITADTITGYLNLWAHTISTRGNR